MDVLASANAAALHGEALGVRVLLAVAAIVLAAHVVGALFARIGQPRVVGEIVAGIALGPSLAATLLPDAMGLLFPAEVVDVLDVLALFGLIFFMFLVGLHLDLDAVARSGRAALVISQVSIVVPLGLGVGTAALIHPVVGAGPFPAFALFVGVAMAITAFPVLARILTDTGLDRTRLGGLTITCAAIDDVTAWCLLSLVVALAQAGGPGDTVLTLVLSVSFAALMLGVVRPLLARAVARAHRAARQPRLSAGLIAGVLASAWITEQIGIHAIFGAFLAGVVVPRSPELVQNINHKLDDVTRLFLLPTFFVVIGLSTRIDLLDRPELWAITALVTAVAIVGKLGGATLAARACKLSWREASTVGVLMNARGLTEIVILTIGANLGVISPELFTAMVLMALVTTLMTTPLLLRLHPEARLTRAGRSPSPPSSATESLRRSRGQVADYAPRSLSPVAQTSAKASGGVR